VYPIFIPVRTMHPFHSSVAGLPGRSVKRKLIIFVETVQLYRHCVSMGRWLSSRKTHDRFQHFCYET